MNIEQKIEKRAWPTSQEWLESSIAK